MPDPGLKIGGTEAVNFYPLTKMNFIVSIGNSNAIAAFSEVTGIEASVDVIEFRQGNSDSLAPIKIPGLVKHGNVTLKAGYTRTSEFKKWIIGCVSEQRGKSGGADEKSFTRKDVTIELVDISSNMDAPKTVVTTATPANICWTLKNAWVTKYSGPDLNASTSEVAIESVEIAYEALTIPNV